MRIHHLNLGSMREIDSLDDRPAALGHDPADVRHIVLTHLDVDHSGGLRHGGGAGRRAGGTTLGNCPIT